MNLPLILAPMEMRYWYRYRYAIDVDDNDDDRLGRSKMYLYDIDDHHYHRQELDYPTSAKFSRHLAVGCKVKAKARVLLYTDGVRIMR